MKIDLIWFDSFGAKSSCTLITTKDVSILIDPGIAVMHKTFPTSSAKKIKWFLEGKREIKSALEKANIVIISHYHWDHFLPKDVYLYEKKILFVKNPNEYINDSQRKRAIEFFERIWKYFGKSSIKFEKNKKRKFEDFGEFLKSIKKDFGSYQERRKELLAKGRKWFKNRVEKWKKYKVIPEKKFKDLEIIYPEGKTFKFGKTKIKFSEPRFHGIEYSRTGWVFSLVVEEGRKKFLYTSDLNGPIIEDYADWIIKENPNFLVIDGPMTYMLGYTLNRTNLRRVLENMKRIVEKVKFEILIWDHHLTREPLFRKHTELVWEIAKKKKKKVLTAREFKFGKKPVVELFS